MKTFLKYSQFAFVLLLVVFVSACSDDDSSSSKKLNSVSYKVVDSGSLEHNGSSISGSGSVAFVDSLGEINEGSSFALKFTLEDGGRVVLHAYSSNKLENGVNLYFERSGSTLQNSVEMVGTDGASKSFTDGFSGIDASGTIMVQVDVHNDEAPTHVLVWNGTEEDFHEEEALLNNEDDDTWSSEQGQGAYWGMTLLNATVTTAEASEPKFDEDH